MRKKILVRGPALSQSGYGEQCRFALRSLKTQESVFDIYLENLNWGHTSWLWEDTEERKWFDSLLLKTAQYKHDRGQFDISLQVTIPNEWEKLAPINIGYTAGIETTRIAPHWVEKSYLMDKIIVPSEHSKNVFQSTAYQGQDETGQVREIRAKGPIEAVNFPFKPIEAGEFNLELDYDFNFLTVAQWSPRKNLENTVRWFIEEFIDQEVGLVIKTSTSNNSYRDFQMSKGKIFNVINSPAYKDRKCKLYLVHGYLKEDEMYGLYNHSKIKALVSLSHGEGFGLPLFEAAANGLPIVTTEYSGPCDFLFVPEKVKGSKKKKNMAKFASVEYSMQPIQKEAVWDGVLQAESAWAYPNQGSVKMKLRDVHKKYSIYEKRAKALQQNIKKNFTEDQQYKKFVDLIPGSNEVVTSEEVDKLYGELFGA
jgi:glycosyltransferase involved in cell wall biosynthesis